MFKRFTNKQLLIVFGALSVIYLASMAFGGRSERTFKQTISAIDTASVNQILISPPGSEQVRLIRNGSTWNVGLPEGGTAPTGPNMVKGALGSIAFLEAKQLISKKENDWSEYKVDTAGTQVEVMIGEKKVLDLIIGRFEYKETGMMSYVRNEGDDDTYLVEGFLESNFNRKVDDWRNKTLIPGPATSWGGVIFTYPADSSFQLLKGADNNWMFPDSSAINSAEASSFISKLANTNGEEFIDNAPTMTSPLYQMIIQTGNSSIQIKAFKDPTYGYVLTSSANPGTWFADGNGVLVDKLFVGKGAFAPTE